MNFSAESQHYIEHMRNMMQQRSQGLASDYNPTAALSKLIHGSSFSSGQLASVIQSPMSHLYRNAEKSGKTYEEMFEERRHSIPDSVGSTGSNISPASSSTHDDIAESPPAKVPTQIAHPLSPVTEELTEADGIPPGNLIVFTGDLVVLSRPEKQLIDFCL